MRFREIASINLWDHESIHLGWVNSITFGRFMMADAGFVYGPLREYLLTLLAWLGGKITLEHVREAIPLHVRETGVELTLETRGPEHTRELVRALEAEGYRVTVA